jgi:hypothetical protein
MGRIHRIGQPNDVYIFNFVAANTVEGRVLTRLLAKLEEIRGAMGDRVFDVVGQLMRVNDVRFEDLLREATLNQKAEEDAFDQIERLSPDKLDQLERDTGIALATSHVQIQTTQQQDFRSEEQRLMPRYIEEFFKQACDFLRVNLEVRADGLWRIPYVKEEFRSNTLHPEFLTRSPPEGSCPPPAPVETSKMRFWDILA